MDCDDDIKVKYLLDFNDTSPFGKLQKSFHILNNSNMCFEFQWKIREANILNGHDKYLKLIKDQIKIEPENGTIESQTIKEFNVTVTFDNAEIGAYRMVLRYNFPQTIFYVKKKINSSSLISQRDLI